MTKTTKEAEILEAVANAEAKETTEQRVAELEQQIAAMDKQYAKLFQAYAELFNKYLAE